MKTKKLLFIVAIALTLATAAPIISSALPTGFDGEIELLL